MQRTVFISSTYEDLKKHRRKVWDILEKYNVNVRGMEKFGARKETSLETSLAEVEVSDIYVGIIALRLGSINKETGKSITQLEYERAYELNKEILIYLIDEKKGVVHPEFIDWGDKHEKLDAFKAILRERHTIDTFIDENDLGEKLRRRFDELLSKKEFEKREKFDEYQNSKNIIQKFCLLPGAYSGREIKLKVKFIDEPFPASKEICGNFNLEYGKTIGSEIKIVAPPIYEKFAEHIFISHKFAEDFLKVKNEPEVEIYVKLSFSENTIKNVRAYFVPKTYVSIPLYSEFLIGTGKIIPTKSIPAEGTIALILTNIIKKDKNEG